MSTGGKLARDEMVGPRNLKRVAGYIIDFACDMYALLKRKSAVHVYCLNGRVITGCHLGVFILSVTCG